jgi:prepilin-type N-terminal cleavage/methylation domain-containing protein
MNKRKGFTLLEMLIVVSIISVLVLLFSPNGFTIIKNSQIKEQQASAKYLETELNSYYLENSIYPDSITPVIISTIDTGSVSNIKNQLEVNNLDPDLSYADIIAAGGFKNIDGTKLKNVKNLNARLVNFFYIDTIPKTTNYNNELVGYVFSYGSKKDSGGTLYSGFYNFKPSIALQPCATGGFTCIMTAFDLNDLRNHLSDTSVKYRLGADINLISYDAGDGLGWMPIATEDTNPFAGQLDGNGFKIKNLTINRPLLEYYTGLFGVVSEGIIKNINLTDYTIIGQHYVGGVAGLTINTTVSNVTVNGDITGNYYVGGVSGYSKTSILDRIVSKSDVSGGNTVGGIIGFLYTETTPSQLNNSYSEGNVVTTNDIAGGLVGEIYGGSVSRSFATGNVTSTGNFIGGLVGYMYTSLADNPTLISDTYARGKVTGNSYVGGLIGHPTHTYVGTAYPYQITNSFSTGPVVSDTIDVGGSMGNEEPYATLNNIFYDSNTSGRSDTGRGVPKTTVQMQTQATYAGYDFSDIWKIIPGSYPTLKNMP